MFKSLSAIAFLAMSYPVAHASPVTPCASGTLQSYLALSTTGCSVGDLDFSGFTALPLEGGASAISPSNIFVTPTGSGLELTLNASASTGQLLDLVYGFDVSSLSGEGLTADSLGLSGSSATADGAVTGLETSCVGAFTASGACAGAMAGRNLAVYSLSDLNHSLAATSFASTPVLGVTMDLSADGGLSGSATLGAISAQFKESAVATPEPGTVWLAIFSGTALVLFSARVQSKKQFKKHNS